MALITNGRRFIRDLETLGALGLYVPSEGGFEGRYQRRLRAAGYPALHLSAPGLGDLSSYLTGVHGVRPPHLGKVPIHTRFIPPVVQYHLENLPPQAKGLVLWIIDGKKLSRQELEFLTLLPKQMPQVKVAIELGGDRAFRWLPLEKALISA